VKYQSYSKCSKLPPRKVPYSSDVLAIFLDLFSTCVFIGKWNKVNVNSFSSLQAGLLTLPDPISPRTDAPPVVHQSATTPSRTTHLLGDFPQSPAALCSRPRVTQPESRRHPLPTSHQHAHLLATYLAWPLVPTRLLLVACRPATAVPHHWTVTVVTSSTLLGQATTDRMVPKSTPPASATQRCFDCHVLVCH
jgi:hypothetical protein